MMAVLRKARRLLWVTRGTVGEIVSEAGGSQIIKGLAKAVS